MPAWNPSMPWPSGTPGGTSAPAWGGYVRLWIRAAIAAGTTFYLGAHANDRLDAGNVLGGGGAVGRAALPTLWVDLTCDVLDVDIAGGASSAQGIFSKADARTLSITLADPEGIYDPLNPSGPFAYGGHSRLVPGVPVEAFAEVVNGDDGTWQTHYLFTGTADSWGEDWVPRASQRRAQMVATDATKTWVRYDRPEQAAQGAGETTAQRINRLVTFYGWTGTVEAPASSAVTLQATTLAQSGWELLNRVLDDELGWIAFTPEGHLRWCNRDAWSAITPPVLALGCPDLEDVGDTFHDVLVDASPSNLDLQMKNSVYAAREGGTSQHASSSSSLERYGPYEYQRTDLGLATDTQAATWATMVVQLYAFPAVQLEDVTLRPALDPAAWEVWNPALAIRMVTDLVRVVWAPPGIPEHRVDGLLRVVGVSHRITRSEWSIKWELVAASNLASSGFIFTLGPDANDRLDAGFVLG